MCDRYYSSTWFGVSCCSRSWGMYVDNLVNKKLVASTAREQSFESEQPTMRKPLFSVTERSSAT